MNGPAYRFRQIEELLTKLRTIDDSVNRKHFAKTGIYPTFEYKAAKVAEEEGEVIEVAKPTSKYGPNRKSMLSREIWDTVFAVVSQGLVYGLTNEEFLQGLDDTITKLRLRWET